MSDLSDRLRTEFVPKWVNAIIGGKFSPVEFLLEYRCLSPEYDDAHNRLPDLVGEVTRLQSLYGIFGAGFLFRCAGNNELLLGIGEAIARLIPKHPDGKSAVDFELLDFIVKYEDHLMAGRNILQIDPLSSLEELKGKIEGFIKSLPEGKQVYSQQNIDDALKEANEKDQEFYARFKNGEIVKLPEDLKIPVGLYFYNLLDKVSSFKISFGDSERLLTYFVTQFSELARASAVRITPAALASYLTRTQTSFNGPTLARAIGDSYQILTEDLEEVGEITYKFPLFAKWGMRDAATLAHALVLVNNLPELGNASIVREKCLAALAQPYQGNLLSAYTPLAIGLWEVVEDKSKVSPILASLLLGDITGTMAVCEYSENEAAEITKNIGRFLSGGYTYSNVEQALMRGHMGAKDCDLDRVKQLYSSGASFSVSVRKKGEFGDVATMYKLGNVVLVNIRFDPLEVRFKEVDFGYTAAVSKFMTLRVA